MLLDLHALGYREIDELTFVVNAPPVSKMRPRLARNGRVYTPGKTRDYEYLVRDVAIRAAGACKWEAADAFYALEVEFNRAKAIGDLDNYVKSVSDALNGVVWPDDRRVRLIAARVNDDKKSPPRASVRITKIEVETGG